MRGVFDDIIVKVPKQTGVFINWSDKNKVIYSQGSVRDKNGNPKRLGSRVIGYAISATEMHPNSNYSKYFPGEWKAVTDEEALPDIKKFGINLAISTICDNRHIRSTLNKSIREDFASAILDFAGYSIFFRDAVIEHFATSMEDQILISTESHDAAYYYDLLKNKITEGHAIAFRREWAKECIAQGDTDVWLCIDGSNNDCECTGVEFVERGFAKSHRNVTLVGYSFAVTEKGKPVTYEAYRGGMVDQQALKSLIASVESYGFHVKGVILDRGYCYYNVIEYLRSKNILFVVMLKSNVQAYGKIMELYGNSLRLLPGENWIEGTYLYGASEQLKLYKGSKREDTVCLYYDINNASGRIRTFLAKINKALISIRKAISNNTAIPTIDKEVKKYLEFEYPNDASAETVEAASDDKPSEMDHSNSSSSSDMKSDAAPVPSEDQTEESITQQEEREAETKGDDIDDEAENDKKSDDETHTKVKRPIGVNVIHEKLQKCTGIKGFFSIASSDSLSPREVYSHYSHRDISETTYMIFKGQEGFGEVRVHSGKGIQAKFLVGFVTSIIRFYFEQGCSELDVPTNEMFRKLNLIKMKKSSDVYFYSDETDHLVKDFLKKISVKQGWSETYIKAENGKLHANQAPKAPRKPGPKPGSHHRQFDEQGNEVKRKPGPKPGSHHKQKYNKDGSERKKPGPKPGSHRGEFNQDGSKRQKPGPKPGSKHKKQANEKQAN